MDLENAVHAHAEWKVKLRAAIAKKDTLDAKTVSADNQCALGKWLHGDGKSAHGKLAAFSECVNSHAAFHRAAGQVVQAINAKKFDEASKMLEAGTPFAKASTAVGIALAMLKRETTR